MRTWTQGQRSSVVVWTRNVFSDTTGGKRMERVTFVKRAARLRRKMEEEGLDGIVIVPGPNLRYLTDVESILLARPFVLLIPAEEEAHLVAPAIEAGPYSDCPLALTIHSWTDSEGYSGAISAAVKEVGFRGKWGVDGRVPFRFLEKLAKERKPKFVDSDPLLQGLREIKDEHEVKLLKRSARILSKSFELLPGLLREGMTEVELANAATTAIYSNGASKVEGMHVQSGRRAADPHSESSSKKVRRGEGVIFDVGVVFDGYYSDVTRTLCLGTSKDVEEVYHAVLRAQEAAIGTAGAGVKAGEVDAAARGELKKAGLGQYFIHRTGHGLGLELQEAPYIVEGGQEGLKRNMCFTVEPGVYKSGRLGVRLEDDVLIDGKRGVSITNIPKEFGWWR
jgi:Xaa-Pro dipeptidase